MTRLVLSFLASIFTLALAYTTAAQSQFGRYGFTDDGAFQLTVTGAADLDASQDLQTWAKYASLTQSTALEDLASRQMDTRFYRIRGGAATSNIIGYVKVTIPAGKVAVLGNAFGSPLRLESSEGRQSVFGTTNPAVKVSFYTNGNFVAHTFDAAAGAWQPPLRGVHAHEGFAVQNTGTGPLTVRLSGEVRQGRYPMSIPAGASLVVPAAPQAGPVAQLLPIPATEGTQLLWFNEQTQAYQTSAFDTLDGGGKWEPKVPDLAPGRAIIVKAPKPLSWTNSFTARSMR
jgi:hypothetical protein